MAGRNIPLDAIWKVGLVSRGRKSAEQVRMERRLHGLKTTTLCRRVAEAQEDKTLFEMSRLLVGLTKIIHQQSAQVYKESLSLLSKVRRELTSNTQMTINPALTKLNDGRNFTLKDSVHFMEGPHRTRTGLIDYDDSPLLLLESRGYDTAALTPPPPSPFPLAPMASNEIRNTILVLDSQETEPDVLQPKLRWENAQAGPSRHPLVPDQRVSDCDMSNDQGWASMLAEFSGPAIGASQEVPTFPPRNFHLAYPRRSEPAITQVQVPSPDFFDFASFEISPPVSLRTADYSSIRPYPNPSPPPPRRQRRRRILPDGLQVVPLEDVMDDPTTIPRYAQDTRALLTYDPEVVAPHPSVKKQKEDELRRFIRLPNVPAGLLSTFWDQSQFFPERPARQEHSNIERARLELGRDRDPSSQDSFMYPDFMDDQDDLPQPSTTMNDMYDFNQMSLGDDQPSTSTRRRQQQQSELFHGASSVAHHSDPTEERALDYSELLEMDVQPPPLDYMSFDFDLYLGTFDNREECKFDDIFPAGPEGSRRSEAALGFYYILESAGALRVLPVQDTPYGPITLHLP